MLFPSSIIKEINMTTLTIDELNGLLKSHEAILNMALEQEKETVLHVKTLQLGE